MDRFDDVAHALMRAASRLISTPGRVQHFHRRRQEWRRGTHECVRHITLPRLAAFGLIFVQALLADGGSIRLRAQADPFAITVFEAETSSSSGTTDMSILVQDAATLTPVLDAGVWFDSKDPAQHVPATLGAGQNKLLYSATVRLPSEGSWPYTVHINRGEAHIAVGGTIQIPPDNPAMFAFWGYVAVVPLAILLFILHGTLVRRRNLRR